MEHSPKFWDKIAVRYAKSPVADEAAYQKKLEVTRGYFRPEMEVLELGCGTGSTAITHAPYVKHIRAVDISSKMLEIARDKANEAGIKNITFEQSAIDDINVPDQSLDGVLALSVLHLVHNREEVAARVFKMLRPGGVFVTSTACIGNRMKFFKLIAPLGKLLGLMPYVEVFTTQELADCITGAGFKIDYQWQPEKAMSVFIVAKKVE